MAVRLPLSMLVFALATLAPVAAGAAPAAQSSAPIVSVSPSSATASPGDDFMVQYMVDDVPELPGLGGYVLSVSWNPAVLEMLAFVDEGFVTNGELIVICSTPTIDNALGAAVLFCSPVPIFAAPGVSTDVPVPLARALFRAKAAGTTSIDLAGSYLIDAAQGQVTATLQNGQVTVEGDEPTAQPASPTARPEPSATAILTPDALDPTPAPAATSPASTNGDGGALSSLKPPQVGSGSEASRNIAWWLPGSVLGALLVVAGVAAGYQHRKRDELAKANGSASNVKGGRR